MNDRPTVAEIVDAVRGFLEKELLPTLGNDPYLRFQTLVAVNALNIAGRQLASEEKDLLEEWQQLTQFLGHQEARPASFFGLSQRVAELNVELCLRIRAREFVDAASNIRLMKLLRYSTEQKLRIANPRYLSTKA